MKHVLSCFGALSRLALMSALVIGTFGNRSAAIASYQATPPSSATFQSLDGEWQIAVDPADTGKANTWFQSNGFPLDASRPIQVPGNVFETWPDRSDVVWADPKNRIYWYSRTFTPAVSKSTDARFYLRFGAVQHLSEVWLNGTSLGTHEGGESPFEFDVTKLLLPNQLNRLTVRVASPFIDGMSQWVPVHVFGGINQHVILATQPTVRIKDVFAKPDIMAGNIQILVTLENNGSSPADVALSASYSEFKPRRVLGTVNANAHVPPGQMMTTIVIPIKQPHLWNLDDPFLYTIKVATDWKEAGSQQARHEEYSTRTGFRDFRVVDGYFQLNGKRIYVKAAHANWFDPIVIHGTPSTMTYLSQDFPLMKSAGFNMMRFIISAAMPEQLDQADELGFLIYSEHETSWLLKDQSQFGITLNDVVRRDRNHPSLVIWGLLNETKSPDIYNKAKAWLPSLRAIDDTRLVLLSSGRWDTDFKTGSASNPGASNWDVFWGGEDPQNPVPTGELPTEVGGYRNGTGDTHVYHNYPTTWEFVTAFANLGRNTKPFFLSEAGIGSSYNAIGEKRKMQQAHAPAGAYAWRWIDPAVQGLEQAWTKYGLHSIYPSIESMLIDSSQLGSRQRELMFNIIRSNPKIVGYNLTSLTDAWGAAEGVMDNFREFKPGYLPVLKAGWARLRWCLFVNPMNVYADQPFRLKVALANEDELPQGDYPATLRISGKQGVVWEKQLSVRIQGGSNPPFAYTVLDEDVSVPNLSEGTYTLSAALTGTKNATSNELNFTVTGKDNHPKKLGKITVLGVDQKIKDLLISRGATLHDYAEGEQIEKEVIIVGDSMKADAATWRSLYARIAQGAHAVFLSKSVLAGKTGPNKWIAVKSKGGQSRELDWLYHKDVIAKDHPVTTGLQTKIMTPDYYAGVLSATQYFKGISAPDDTVAVAIRCTYSGSEFSFGEGVMLGTYKFHAGRFTINAFDIVGNVGNPAADRLLLNLVAYAESDVVTEQPLPIDLNVELDSLGITD